MNHIVFTLSFLFCMAGVVCGETDCTTDCSAKVHNRARNQTRVVPCSIQKRMNSLDGPIRWSDDFGKPELLEDSLWYLYRNHDRNQTKIALNITWKIPQNRSLQLLKGYSVLARHSTTTTSGFRYFSFTKSFSNDDDVVSSFSYLCFGKSPNFIIHPGDTFYIQIDSHPISLTNRVRHHVKIPTCGSPEFGSSLKCEIEEVEEPVVTIGILPSCENRTKKIRYNVPEQFGTRARALMCQLKWFKFCVSHITYQGDLPLKGTISFKLPEGYNIAEKFVVQVWGSTKGLKRFQKDISFADCYD